MSAQAPSLSWILDPITQKTFFEEYWEKKPLVIQRENRGHFDGLLTIEDIDRLVSTTELHEQQLQLVAAGRTIRTEEYTFPSGMIDAARAFALFGEGGTMILPMLQMRIAPLAALCRALERDFSLRFQTNIYFTPPSAQGFGTHYDNHDVFVLQVAGSKKWRLYDTPVELPMRGQHFDPKAITPGAVTSEFTLRVGECCYVPRGVMHDAQSTDELSMHVTVGVMNRTWADLLIESISQLCVSDPEFRQSLPRGFANDGFDRAASQQHFQHLLRRLVEKAQLDPAMDHFVDDLVSTRHPVLTSQLAQIRRLPALSADSLAGARASLIYRIEESDEHVALLCNGAEVKLPKHAATTLRAAITSPRYVVRELPGDLDADGKVVLVRRLIKEGLAQQL